MRKSKKHVFIQLTVSIILLASQGSIQERFFGGRGEGEDGKGEVRPIYIGRGLGPSSQENV